jgi:hypothetical protein
LSVIGQQVLLAAAKNKCPNADDRQLRVCDYPARKRVEPAISWLQQLALVRKGRTASFTLCFEISIRPV